MISHMVRVKPFAAVRPPKELVTEVAAPPYDVLNSAEALAMAGEKSLLHITKPEIDFNPIADEHAQPVYDRAVANYKAWKERGWLVRDPVERYYVYAQTMGKRTQYGLVLCAHTDDYATGRIKKHELTRKDKEDDRMIHVRIQNANIEPVFFAYKDHPELNAIVAAVAAGKPEYRFTDENGFGHTFWVIADDAVNARITEIFTTQVDAFYVADGNFKVTLNTKRTDSTGYTAQGMGSDDSYVYFPMSGSKDNVLVVYDWAGKFVTTLTVPLTIESESMFYAAGRYYVAFYAGSKVGASLYEIIPVHYYSYSK